MAVAVPVHIMKTEYHGTTLMKLVEQRDGMEVMEIQVAGFILACSGTARLQDAVFCSAPAV